MRAEKSVGVVGSGKSRAQGSAGMAGAEPEPEPESLAVCLTEAADEDAEAVVAAALPVGYGWGLQVLRSFAGQLLGRGTGREVCLVVCVAVERKVLIIKYMLILPPSISKGGGFVFRL